MQTRRTVAAFLVAPLAVPLVFSLLGLFSPGISPLGWLAGVYIVSFYALPLAYLAELGLGVPAWMIFKHYNIRSFPAFAVGGASLGLLFYLGMEAWVGNLISRPLLQEFNPFRSAYLNLDVIAGSASALLFRSIVYSGVPRKSSKEAIIKEN
jgi:hypothetical protein